MEVLGFGFFRGDGGLSIGGQQMLDQGRINGVLDLIPVEGWRVFLFVFLWEGVGEFNQLFDTCRCFFGRMGVV